VPRWFGQNGRLEASDEDVALEGDIVPACNVRQREPPVVVRDRGHAVEHGLGPRVHLGHGQTLAG